MPTNQIPYLVCKNVRCGHTIWLPRSSQLDKFPDRLDSDNQFAEIYVCPTCVHAYDYRVLNVHWTPPRHDTPTNLWALSADAVVVECDKGNCRPPALLRKTTMEPLDAGKLLKEAESWVLAEVHCSNGHPLNRIPPDSLVVRVSIP
jgi:hypothetical protein